MMTVDKVTVAEATGLIVAEPKPTQPQSPSPEHNMQMNPPELTLCGWGVLTADPLH